MNISTKLRQLNHRIHLLNHRIHQLRQRHPWAVKKTEKRQEEIGGTL